MPLYGALVWMGKDSVEVVKRSTASPVQGEVLLMVRAAGICGTDLHILSGSHPQAKPPLVPGHEFAGEVVAVGEGVDQSLLGRRVGVDSYLGCGNCINCRLGLVQQCERGTCELGVNVDGGWAEYVTVPARNLYLLPDAVSFDEAGAGCILNCSMAAIEAVGIQPGDRVLIIGDGPSSLVMLQLARMKGASRVMLAGHRKRRLTLGAQLGADFVVNTTENQLEDAVRKLSGGPNVVIDAVGTSMTMASALALAGTFARVHLFGLPHGPMSGLPMDMFLWKELRLSGSTGAPSLWPVAMDYLSRGLLKVKPIVSHRFPLADGPAALKFIRENPQEVIKAIFHTG